MSSHAPHNVIATIAGIPVYQDSDGHCHWIAGAAIDADGANGQHGRRPAYNNTNTGLDHLANGGMKKAPGGRVAFAEAWAKNIVITTAGGSRPLILEDGTVPSKTAYRYPGMGADDPRAYVDSAAIPYIVIPPLVRQKARGVVMGCDARVTNTKNGRSVDAVVADIGPGRKLGELSIAAAEALGINPSPRIGGSSERVFLYEMWPGQSATLRVDDKPVKFPLIPA